MSDEVFLKPRLIGARFEGGVIPLDVLADFAGLNELLIETARWEFLKANQGRKRSPRGFAKGFQLQLTAIEDGSAMPVIRLAAAVAALLPQVAFQYVEQARDTVISTIDAAATGKPITLPPRLLAHFDRFGRSLEDGEAIEFPSIGDGRPAVRLDKKVRRTLLLAPGDVVEVTDAAAILGLVPNVQQTNRTFEVELPDGRRIPGPLTRQHRDAILDAAKGYANRQRVLIDGVGRYDRTNRLVGVDSIDAVTAIDPLDIGIQLDELRSLRPGWFNGEGSAFKPEMLDQLERLFSEHYPEDLALPHLYPTPEGNIRAEWSLRPFEASLEIEPATYRGYWHVLNLTNDADEAVDLGLIDSAEWSRLSDLIRKISGGNT